MSKKTRMTRVHVKMDELLENVARNMSQQTGLRITKTDASYLIAMQNATPPTLVKKKGRKFVLGGALVRL